MLIALGGNAMTGPDGSATPRAQYGAVASAVEPVADLVAGGAEIVLTHGNGPQVGNLLIKNQLAAHVVPPVPLDWCGAQTQATIGALVMSSLERAMAARGVDRRVAVVVTRTIVDRADPGFADPAKPVGRYFSAQEATRFAAMGQTWRSFGPKGWRRVVPSPEPVEILDAPAVDALLAAGFVVVAAGGGGMPVMREDGGVRGVEAVVDKDLTAQLLARHIGASTLVIATNVDHVMIGYDTPGERPVGRTTAAWLRAQAAAEPFARGSMGPKVEAALRFVEAGGRRAAITRLDRIADAADGKAGTVVEQD
jgi:carbamate kinase